MCLFFVNYMHVHLSVRFATVIYYVHLPMRFVGVNWFKPFIYKCCVASSVDFLALNPPSVVPLWSHSNAKPYSQIVTFNSAPDTPFGSQIHRNLQTFNGNFCFKFSQKGRRENKLLFTDMYVREFNIKSMCF